jgi:DNA-binding HxlR family transcriptional regulator
MNMKKPTKAVPGQDCMRSVCPVSSVLDIIGDKWTLLVIRDMLFLEKSTYSELADSMEKIPTNMLADRLKKLEAAEIVEKKPYQDKPVRYVYSLTKRGKALKPVMQEMASWGNDFIAGTATPPKEFMEK